MNKEGSRKRKRNIIEVLNGTTEQSKLKIQVVDYIPCTICQLPVNKEEKYVVTILHVHMNANLFCICRNKIE